MDGWRIRKGIEGDVPFLAVMLVVFGGVVATVVHVTVDVLLHHHSLKVRHPAGRTSHRH